MSSQARHLAWLILAILSCAILILTTGCSTGLYSPVTGKPLMKTYGDSQYMKYTGAGVTFEAVGLNHSTPTRAAGSVVGTTGTAVSGVAATLLSKGL